MQCTVACDVFCVACVLESIRNISCNWINFDLYFYNRKLIRSKQKQKFGVLSGGDSFSMEMSDIFMPSGFTIEKREPEVSHVLGGCSR